MVTCRTPSDHVAAADWPPVACAPLKAAMNTSVAAISPAPAIRGVRLQTKRRVIVGSSDGLRVENSYRAVLVTDAASGGFLSSAEHHCGPSDTPVIVQH